MKSFLLPAAAAAVLLTSCTTLENRRDLYFPQQVNGPYTRMLKDGLPKTKTQETTTVVATSGSDGKSVVR